VRVRFPVQIGTRGNFVLISFFPSFNNFPLNRTAWHSKHSYTYFDFHGLPGLLRTFADPHTGHTNFPPLVNLGMV
jgi:hypothetical protein